VTVYSVYEPSGSDADTQARADKIAFVKEGFNWPALIVPVLWLIYQRMWLELIVFVAVIGMLPFLFGASDAGREAAGWVSIGLTLLFAFEANDLRGWALKRRGYRFSGVVSGRDRIAAERSFFTAWLPEQARAARRIVPPAIATPPTGAGAATPRSRGGDEVIGSFPRA
jgi:Protein of unknown function (DUF2628)